jgi:ADP-ribose pyrophosphatase
MTDWQTIEENLKYQDNRFKIYVNKVKSPNGKELELKKITIKPGAHLVAVTSEGKIPLIKQYRYPCDEYFLEIPSGGVDVEKESYKDAAIREFEEETGYFPENVEFVAKAFHSAALDFPYEIYFSKDLELRKRNIEEAEFGSEVILLTYNECMEKIKSGEIYDSSTIACLALCKNKGLI